MEKLNNPRELRGLAILSMGNAITKVEVNAYMVKSQTGIGEYTIKKDGRAWSCTCPNFAEYHLDCKHIYAVKFSLKLREDVEAENEPEKAEKPDFIPEKCPVCQGVNIIRRGVRKTKYGDAQRFGCLDCNHRFTIDKGFSRMKHDPKAITLAMDLYFKGISYRKICDHLRQFYGLGVNQTTPMRWVRKYLRLLAQYSEKYKAEVGNIWHSDEMTVFIKKEDKEKYYEWIWNVMDAKTRYLLACRVSKTRFVEDAVKPLHDAKVMADRRPDAVVTDGLRAYQQAVKDEFYDNTASIKNPHLRLRDFETKPNNNIVERLNGTFRERMKVMRSLSTGQGATDYVKGMQVYYNYIRGHQGLDGKTPAEMANIPIDLSGNRWQTMIELASQNKCEGC
jgi:putative transposase